MESFPICPNTTPLIQPTTNNPNTTHTHIFLGKRVGAVVSSPHACVGFLRVLWLSKNMHVKLPVCVMAVCIDAECKKLRSNLQ